MRLRISSVNIKTYRGLASHSDVIRVLWVLTVVLWDVSSTQHFWHHGRGWTFVSGLGGDAKKCQQAFLALLLRKEKDNKCLA
jgi:hypothetical protein